MAVTLEEPEAQALKLSVKERSELVHRLIVSLDGEPEGAPEEIARAWEEEIARRVADMDAGRTEWNSLGEIMTELRARIKATEADAVVSIHAPARGAGQFVENAEIGVGGVTFDTHRFFDRPRMLRAPQAGGEFFHGGL